MGAAMICKSITKTDAGYIVHMPDNREIKCKTIVELCILLHNLIRGR